ncbi:MAG: TolC family protein [Prevotellaceae bacterium]|jgi:outer membrane protein TolC|nr:TolC family protein [Prevotellaceae bacterium]
MKRYFLHFPLTLLLFSVLPLRGQEPLPLYDCIRQAVENNYAVKITRNRQAMAENNVTYKPFLPNVTASGTQNQSHSHSHSHSTRTLASSPEETTIDAKANNLNAGLSLSWRMFDGLAMFATYNRQKEALSVSEQEVKMSLENLVAQVCFEYYNIIVLKNRLSAAQYTLALSQERYQQAMEMYTLGSSSGLDLRQAKIDLNADSSTLVMQEEVLQNAYIRLNTLMNMPLANDGYVNDSIELLPKMDRQELAARTLNHNSSLKAARLGKRLSELDLKIAHAARFPTVDFNTGYNYTFADTPSAAITYNRSNGFNWGFSLSWTLFNGFDTRRRIKNARLEVKGSELNYQQVENNIMSDLALLYNTYERNLLMINFEIESVETAFQTLDAAISRYRVGSLSGIEFREYQKNYLEAVDRKFNAMYQAKLSEINLRIMCGELVMAEPATEEP